MPTEQNRLYDSKDDLLQKGQISLKNGVYEGRLTLIRSNVELPSFLGEFGINYQPLLKLGRLAGFRLIRIVSDSTDSSETTFGLQGGIGRDGTLRGSVSTATTYVPEANSNIVFGDADIDSNIPRGRMWADLTIKLNIREILSRIGEVNNKDALATHLNAAIGQQILIQGAHNLLRSGDARNERDAAINGVLFPILGHLLFSGLVPVTHLEMFISPIVYLVGLSYGPFRLNTRRGNGPARFSLLGTNAPAVDRVAALFGATQLTRLASMVKPIASSQKNVL